MSPDGTATAEAAAALGSSDAKDELMRLLLLIAAVAVAVAGDGRADSDSIEQQLAVICGLAIQATPRKFGGAAIISAVSVRLSKEIVRF